MASETMVTYLAKGKKRGEGTKCNHPDWAYTSTREEKEKRKGFKLEFVAKHCNTLASDQFSGINLSDILSSTLRTGVGVRHGTSLLQP
jgi:hypothetical protein